MKHQTRIEAEFALLMNSIRRALWVDKTYREFWAWVKTREAEILALAETDEDRRDVEVMLQDVHISADEGGLWPLDEPLDAVIKLHWSRPVVDTEVLGDKAVAALDALRDSLCKEPLPGKSYAQIKRELDEQVQDVLPLAKTYSAKKMMQDEIDDIYRLVGEVRHAMHKRLLHADTTT